MFHAKTLLQNRIFCAKLNYMAKIIAFSNHKGGVGKTTACVNVAACLAENGKRVLVVDLDAQANATSSLGIFDKNPQYSSYDLLCGNATITDCIRETAQQTGLKTLKTIAASENLAGAELELAGVEDREHVLEKALAPIKDEFDYIFMDCAPSLSLVTVNALTAANGVIVPIVCEYFALEGLAQTINTVKLVRKHLNLSLNVLGVVLAMYDGRSKLAREVKAQVDNLFGDKVFETVVPRNVRLAEAPSYGKPINLYDNKCAGAKAYAALAQEFIQKI